MVVIITGWENFICVGVQDFYPPFGGIEKCELSHITFLYRSVGLLNHRFIYSFLEAKVSPMWRLTSVRTTKLSNKHYSLIY